MGHSRGMDKIRTTGIIEQTIYKDTGNVMYIVNVKLNEDIVKAQSINYSSKTKSLPDGKSVVVDYWETPKGNKLVEIVEENMIPCEKDLAGELRTLIGFAIIVVIVIIGFMIQK
jgi:hypothetical protein